MTATLVGAADTTSHPRTTRYPAAPTASFSRLVGVEFRKLVDTRAGFWLIAVGLALMVVAPVLAVWSALAMGPEDLGFPLTWHFTTWSAASVLGLLMGIVGVLTITTEWTQRTALVTFALEPRRGRVLAAKAVVLTAVAALGMVFALAVGAAIVGVVQAMGLPASWEMSGAVLAGLVATVFLDTALGAVFGLLLLHSVGGVVAIFTVPMLWQIITSVGAMSKPLADALPWLVPGHVLSSLQAGTIAGIQWAQLATALTLWLVLPAAIGTVRWLRRQVA